MKKINHKMDRGPRKGFMMARSTGTDMNGKPAYLENDRSAKKNRTKLMRELGII